MPFTMEGTTVDAIGSNNGFCVAALVLGIIGLPTFFIVFPALLAVIFGVVGLRQIANVESPNRSGRGMAIAGIVCGSLGCVFASIVYLARF
jgi:hypothetical protein